MPDESPPKPRAHPLYHASNSTHRAVADSAVYAELCVTTNFTFLTGASHPDECVRHAASLGHRAIAVTDTNTLAGIVRAHVAAKDAGIQLIVGCRVRLAKPWPLDVLVYPTDLASYGRLCRLLTLGKRRAAKGECLLDLHDLLDHQEGLLAAVIPPSVLSEEAVELLSHLHRVFDEDRLSIAASRTFAGDERSRLTKLAAFAHHVRVPMVATNDVHHHTKERRSMQDVVTCIRLGTTLEQAGYALHPNSERHLKHPEEMHRLWRDHPAAIERTLVIAERTKGFSLDQLRYNYPRENVPEGTTPMSHLRDLTLVGAVERYAAGVPDAVMSQINHEFRVIEELDYARYFLTVHDLVRKARELGILCQGRGAAANSAVCYCLGITAVDPTRVGVLFERFVSKERDEPPDIDIDFEHERREEVIQYLYSRYGRDRAALTAEVISYRGRSAVRDVGKAMGLSLDAVETLAKDLDWWDQTPGDPRRVSALGLDPRDPTLTRVLAHVKEIVGFPRHLSQHVGGFILTQTPLLELVPIENAAMADRTVIEWDKDDIEALGMLKIDVLGLGMLTCLRRCMELVKASQGRELTLATIPAEDTKTYDMICKADTVGVFQIESRAQMSMLPRLKPRCYYDLVIEVAIVRPGPIQGDMVHPYLRRRNGEEPVTYHSPEIERVLGRTLGVPLFQEQCMSLAVSAAGFTPGEADQLRRAMAAWKRSGAAILKFERKLIDGMIARGYSQEFAGQVFTQISGFSGYGFPESHAASFALLVYASCWLKCHTPAAFAAALINSQPMGFYQPAQIIRDAKEHGVEVRPIDAILSRWDCTLEPTNCARPEFDPSTQPAIRLGMRLVKGLSQAHAERVVAMLEEGPRPRTLDELARIARKKGVPIEALRHLARADAFGSLGLSRRQALWTLTRLDADALPLFDGLPDEAAHAEDADSSLHLPMVNPADEVTLDYARAQLSLKAHPISFVREELDRLRVVPARHLRDETHTPAGTRVTVAGLVLVRQRPGTASGIVFMTIEDETGIANVIVFPKVYQRCRAAAKHSVAVLCTGRIERQGEVVHLKAARIRRLELHTGLPGGSRDFH